MHTRAHAHTHACTHAHTSALADSQVEEGDAEGSEVVRIVFGEQDHRQTGEDVVEDGDDDHHPECRHHAVVECRDDGSKTREGLWCGIAWRGVAWYCMAWYDMAWYGVAWRGSQCNVVPPPPLQCYLGQPEDPKHT